MFEQAFLSEASNHALLSVSDTVSDAMGLRSGAELPGSDGRFSTTGCSAFSSCALSGLAACLLKLTVIGKAGTPARTGADDVGLEPLREEAVGVALRVCV